jgi:tRNA dimethylallyltransferase
MVEQGLIEEVRTLKERGLNRSMVSMQGLGYKEILDYLDGMCTLEEALYRLKRDTRHFAKRQMTWFRRERQVEFLDMDQYREHPDAFYAHMERRLKERHILGKEESDFGRTI